MNRGRRDRDRQGESGSQLPGNYSQEHCDEGRPARTAENARSLLLAAVDRVIEIATNSTQTTSSSNQASTRPPAIHTDLPTSSQSTSLCNISQNSTRSNYSAVSTPAQYYDSSRDGRSQLAGPNGNQLQSSASSSAMEHKQLFHFGHNLRIFEPCKSSHGLYESRKGKTKRQLSRGPGRPAKSKWKKDCICLRHTDQTSRPSAEEKMVLARDGLGLAEVTFDYDGNACHIHEVLVEKFPQLDSCGSYTLCRLSDNSVNLIEIEHPAKGLSVAYLKDILNQAKLYIRPLQCDIQAGSSKDVEVRACNIKMCLRL